MDIHKFAEEIADEIVKTVMEDKEEYIEHMDKTYAHIILWAAAYRSVRATIRKLEEVKNG